ncbi:MAG TPA: acetate/propionate family kinase [Terriglobales bacterium]|nr:acetate/propionate family kinase [Terriglobales bacterium]
MGGTVLCVNGGSSSLKVALYRFTDGREERLLFGAADEIGQAESRFWLRNAENRTLADLQEHLPDHAAASAALFSLLEQNNSDQPMAAGHRLVHGGFSLVQPQIVTAQVMAQLKDAIAFAPLHLPSQIALIEAIAKRYPDLPQVACFDTAFHSTLPEITRRFPLPRTLYDGGTVRYGFHGLSYEYAVRTLGTELGRRAVIAHLGNGASMAAVRDGASIDTSMGLTPTGGFMMSTRSGDLDPGILLALLRQGRTITELEEMFDHQSGLRGVSGVSGDMKVLLQERAANPNAALAIEMFCYQIRKWIGAYAAALNGLDTLVFTGGIGEHSSEIRAEICSGLECLGLAIDPVKNSSSAAIISSAKSRCTIRVIRTDEDLMVARHTVQQLQTRAPA